MPDSDLCFMTAREITGLIKNRSISAREVMQTHLDQIDRINPTVNAIITRIPDEDALSLADEADRKLADGEAVGPLHGLPIAHKDLVPTKGIRTTWGSPIFADHVPDFDALLIERLRAGGALTIGKTNVPEFGAGSQTFNPVFGPTLNPYDTTKTCGGSSGGAAVSLACGMLPIADGSDTGGSLRNPGNFNNVVGFRNTPGRVPNYPLSQGYTPISVVGAMARTVGDVALMLTAIAGPDRRVPTSIDEPASIFTQSLDRNFKGVKVAWSPTLGGLPVDQRILDVLESQRKTFEDLGCIVEEATPDFTDAEEIFLSLRAISFALGHHQNLKTHRHLIKDTVIWNAEEGLKLSALDVALAEQKRMQLFQRMHEFMSEYEFLLCPVNQVPPFDVNTPYPTEIAGVEMEHYIAWMRSAYYITNTAAPAISVPCGFTPEGLPVGIQIVGRFKEDFSVLQMANAFESATEVWKRRPPVVS